MTAVVDNSVLTLLLNTAAAARPNPETGKPASFVQSRISCMLEDMAERGETLIVPAPALAESMCCASPSEALLNRLRQFACIEISAFDQKAAIEFAELMKRSRSDIRKIKGDASLRWQFVKVDLQIVSIGKAGGADRIITDDGPQGNFATLAGLQVLRTWDLPLTGKHQHGDLFEDGG